MIDINVIIAAIAIFAISTIFSMFGRGGGEFYLPTMLTLLSIPYYTAAGITQFLIMLQGLSMVPVYSKKHKQLDWHLAFLLAACVGAASFLGGFLSKGIPAVYLKASFAIFLLISAVFLFVNKNVKPKTGKFGVWHRKFYGGEYDMNFLYVIIPVSLAGFLAGMAGISGGGLIIPIAILLGGIPLRIAMGTNTFVLLVSTSMGFLGHALKGGIDWYLAAIFALSALTGSQIGSRLHVKVNEKFLRIGFALILIIAASWMIMNIFIK